MEFVLNRPCMESPQKEGTLMAGLPCSRSMARALLRRGMDTIEKARDFLSPGEIPLPDPYGLTDMDKAVAVIRAYAEAGKHICVYGDYDADGVCATAILTRGLQKAGARVSWYIPSRHKEGYGMNKNAVEALRNKGVELIVTVDNGIAAFDEIAFARSLGMEVVVTDHHRLQGDLPQCASVVCVSRDGYRERVNDLCGAGVSYLLVRALLGGDQEDLLPMAAAATAADIVDVTRENRGILYRGMKLVKEQPGFAALLRVAGAIQQPVTEYTLGFVIGPRLNAAGRMGEASIALRLLLSDSREECDALALELEKLNSERRSEEQRIYNACLPQLEQEGESPVLLLAGEDWNLGVVGIVASRLLEKTGKPVILLSRSPEGYTGSGRSIEGIDLFALLTACKDCFLRYGGHAGAAGLTLEEGVLPRFKARLKEVFYSLFPQGAPPPRAVYEDVLGVDDCTAELAKELEKLAPFGPGNETPVFRIPQGQLLSVSFLGKEGKHLSARLYDKEKSIRMVAFGQGEQYTCWRDISRADALVQVQVNRYNGYENCQLYCVALKRAGVWGKDEKIPKIVGDFLEGLRYNSMSKSLPEAKRAAECLGNVFFTEERLRRLYLLLKNGWEKAPMLTLGTQEEKAAALIFVELGFFTLTEQGLAYRENCPRRRIDESLLYRAFADASFGKAHP